MDIKVGEYVRTYNGLIGQVVQITNSNNYAIRIYNGAEYVVRAVIAKHSCNIIDLIEVGDIVFIEDVLNNDFIYIYDAEMLKAVREDVEMGLKITEVLTHELYNANCYKVKGE